jgi:hypothetical protein
MEAVTYLNAGDAMPSEGLSGQDHRQRVSLSWIYELPLLRGWQVQGIYSYQTGAPLLWLDTTRLTAGVPVARGGRNVDRWFETSAFLTNAELRPQRHYRSWPLRFGDLRTDATDNWDLSVIKKLKLADRLELQLRGEFLNAFNHARFKSPNMDPYNKAFGQVSDTAAYPRQIQAGLKATF